MNKQFFVFLLALVSMAASAGQWRYQDEADKMTGKMASYATLLSDNSLALGFPYQGVNHGTLTVRRHPKYGLDVLVSVDKGQILCRSYDGCAISVRFDAGQPQRFSAVGSADHSSEVVFITNRSRFIASARKARKILVQLPMYQSGEQVLEFSSPVELVWK